MSDVVAAPHRVLVVGDLNPDLILTGDVVPKFGQVEQLLDQATLTIGGSAAITAHGLARLGRPVSIVAAIGRDVFGDRLLGDLSGAGVDVGPVLRRDDVPTGLTVVLSASEDRAILTLPGAIPTVTAAEVRSAVRAACGRGVAHLHVASLFLQPALATELPELLAEARAAGLTTSLDTNDDPHGQWLGVDALLPHLDVFLPNRAEVLAIGRDGDPRRAAATLASRGPLVVVKDGADGAFATTLDGDVVHVRGARRQPVDTAGAGDTFDAAFLDGWLDGLGLQECLQRATTAGAFAVAALGGTAGQPTRKDLLDQGKAT
ncbi:carbohydrate kinase family protein [Angustibacter sp. McL0619]|uniref:carbohydrate kinase family protein n=1 Tax=Angustibacter sp. McL0619 TaxID=3415676 RepID=UPI003CF43138